MSNPILPPNPCLLAIILITKTRDGTNNVFHYPPSPGSGSTSSSNTHGGHRPTHSGALSASSNPPSASGSSDSEPDEPADSLTGGTARLYPRDDGTDNGHANTSIDESFGSMSPEKQSSKMWGQGGSGSSITKRDSKGGFLGLPKEFHQFLCPPPEAFNKKRFEMTIDQLVFLGWPVYARADGSWRGPSRGGKGEGGRRKRGAGGSRRRESGAGEDGDRDAAVGSVGMGRRKSVQLDDLIAGMSSEGENMAGTGTETGMEDSGNDVSGFEAGYGHDEDDGNGEEEAPRKEVLSMFHVAFVLSPSPLEYQHRTDEMYTHVVKKFTKALRWEQVRSDFMLKESERLRGLRAKHDSVEAILKQSSLARAMADLYTAISSSKIAQINLTERTSFSLQLPIPNSISVLPSLTEPQLPGLWLTTANSMTTSDDDIDTPGTRLASHFTLLPLQEPSAIIMELTAVQSPLAPYIANFLHHSTPTKSFLQISQNSNIPLSEIQHLASHLIYWRRARAIPPLHIRDIYITSPNADMKKLKSAAASYARQFPALPSLPKMLARLSTSTPAPYSYFLPSRDHKEAYLEILAWLMRGGWVTQLRSFAWIRVPAEARERARQKMKEEEQARHASKSKKFVLHRRQESKGESVDSGDDSASDVSQDAGDPDVPSGYLTPMQSSIYSTATADSASTTKTAIPLQDDLRESELRDENVGPVLILDPKRASGMESRYLTAIAEQIEEELADDGKEVEGKEVREIWEKCVKYFNGQHALEKIAGREGLKRKKIEALRERWKKSGYLLEVRHW